MKNAEGAIDIMHRLKEMQIQIAIEILALAKRPCSPAIQSGFLPVAVAAVVVAIAGWCLRFLWLLDDSWLLFRRAIIVAILLCECAPCDRRGHQHQQQNSF